MSTAITTDIQLHSSTPRFWGIVQGELLKLSRLRITRIMVILLAVLIILANVLAIFILKETPHFDMQQLSFFYGEMSTNLYIFRMAVGVVLIILTAHSFGLEYRYGTIRILLGRGVGRLQLLWTKLTALLIIALLLLLGALLLISLMVTLTVVITQGNVNALSVLKPEFWSNTGLYLLTVLISMGGTILLTTMFSVLGRSLAVGLSAGFGFFAADSVITTILPIVYTLTHNELWAKLPNYFLGHVLEKIPGVLLPTQAAGVSALVDIGTKPASDASGTQLLLVTLGYAIVFIAVSIILLLRRDVKE